MVRAVFWPGTSPLLEHPAAPGRRHHCTASPIRSAEHLKNQASGILPGASLPFAGRARSH